MDKWPKVKPLSGHTAQIPPSWDTNRLTTNEQELSLCWDIQLCNCSAPHLWSPHPRENQPPLPCTLPGTQTQLQVILLEHTAVYIASVPTLSSQTLPPPQPWKSTDTSSLHLTWKQIQLSGTQSKPERPPLATMGQAPAYVVYRQTACGQSCPCHSLHCFHWPWFSDPQTHQ